MVSKMVIEFFLGFTTMKLGEFVYRLAFHATFVVVAGLRVKLTQAEIKAKTVVERSY